MKSFHSAFHGRLAASAALLLASPFAYPQTFPSPPPTLTFLGHQGQNEPPDTQGAVGPDHLMTVSNGYYTVHDKATGNLIGTQTQSYTWWSQRINNLPSLTLTDPRILYDPYDGGGRWISSMCMGRNEPGSALLLAVSANSDPTQGWYAWKIDIDPVNNAYWIDFDRLAFNLKNASIGLEVAKILRKSALPRVELLTKSSFLPVPSGSHRRSGGSKSAIFLESPYSHAAPPLNHSVVTYKVGILSAAVTS